MNPMILSLDDFLNLQRMRSLCQEMQLRGLRNPYRISKRAESIQRRKSRRGLKLTDYQIKWTETVIQSLEKIERDLERRILKRVNGLNANPFRYIKRLKVVPLFSLRVGIYRVSMSIERNNLVIVAIDVGKRENDYDDL